MDTTITKLEAELEELEKRIKALSNAQSALGHLVAIRDYFSKVQEYLEILKDEYSAGTNSCTNCEEKIADLQEQINTINNTISNLPSGGETDLSSIESEIQLLTSLLNNHTTDISDLQTEIGYIQDELDQKTTELSEINSNIGDMQTTITNLQSTQTSMASAHTSMNNSISGLNTRLTTAENNISALTGGVDVSAIDSRLQALEAESDYSNIFYYKRFVYNVTPTSYSFVSPKFGCLYKQNTYGSIKLRLNYLAQQGGTLTITYYIDDNLYQTYTVDLTTNPSHYDVVYDGITEYRHKYAQIFCTCTAPITYISTELFVHGQGAFVCDTPPEISFRNFDGRLYISRRYDGYIKYGAFTENDTIDIDNLPNTFTLQQEDASYTYVEYIPYLYHDSTNNDLLAYCDAFVLHTTENTRKLLLIKNILWGQEKYLKNMDDLNTKHYDGYCIGNYNKFTMLFLNSKKECRMTTANYDNSSLMSKAAPGYTPIGCNIPFKMATDTFTDRLQMPTLIINQQDNCFYFSPRTAYTKPSKVAKGKTATLFVSSEDNIYYAYISNQTSTSKYKLYYNSMNGYYNADLIEVYEDCSFYFETGINKVIKYVPSTKSWLVEDVTSNDDGVIEEEVVS